MVTRNPLLIADSQLNYVDIGADQAVAENFSAKKKMGLAIIALLHSKTYPAFLEKL